MRGSTRSLNAEMKLNLSFAIAFPLLFWVFWLSYEAGHGDCTAEAPFDVAQDRPRTLSKEVLIKKFSNLCELCVFAVNNFFTENPE
jgi:hypothetical protein